MATVTSVQVTYNGASIATGDTISVAVGSTITVYATVLTDTGTDSDGVNWYPMSDGSFFTWGNKTTSSAQITITAAGSQSIYVRAANANSIHVRFTLQGTEGGSTTETVSSVSANVGTSLSMTVGESVTVSAYAYPTTLSDRTVNFTVSGTNYITKSSSTGNTCTIRATAAGTAYLVCAANLDDSVYTIITITVSAAATETVSSVSANISSPYEMTVGSTVNITAYAYPSSLSNRAVLYSIYSGSSYASIVSSGSYTCTVSANAAGTAYLRIYSQLDTSVYTTIRLDISASASSGDPSYSVVTASGASYGFSKTSDGYWTSQNAGVSNSAAVALVVINTPGNYNVYVDCINYGESNFDYGILSNLNYSLSTSYTDDGATGTTSVKQNFKGLQSASVQTVDYGVLSAGTYNIYAKYRKDSSVNSNNDSLKFVVRFEAAAAQETVDYVSANISSPYAMTVGDSLSVTAYAYPSSLSDRTVSFSIYSGTAYASITSSGNNSCTVSANSAGTAVLRIYSDLDSSVYTSITLNISAAAEQVSSVSMNIGTSYALTVGNSISVTAYAYPESLSDRTVTFGISQSGTYISRTNTTNNGCTITAVAAGTAYLYAYSDLDDSVYARCTITVSAASTGTKVTEITISAASYELSVNASVRMTATVTPSSASDTSVSWASEDTSIATVTSAGYITGVHRGRVTISATANDGSGVVATAIFIVRPACYIYNNGWQRATAYIRSSSWEATLPDIYPYITGTTGFQGSTGGSGDEPASGPSYTVAKASGALYGFSYTSGYWTSQNAGIANSAAVAAVTITTPGGYNVYFDCISYGENNFDYGLLSQIGQTLGTTQADDGTTGTSTVMHNFKGESSSSVQRIEYGILDAGTYTIYAKYRKDVNTDSNADSFRFVVGFEKAAPTYSVLTVTGASYGFELTDDGYYTSTNAGVASSAAVCAVALTTPGGYNLYVDCINYAESTYDYGLLSNLGQSLDTTNTADGATGSTKVKKNFSGSQSSSVQTVDYGVLGAGSHLFFVKYIKDGSVDKNNDSLKFTLRFV